MRRNEPVKYGKKDREIVLFNSDEGTILGKFITWNGKTASKIEITYNSFTNFEILSAEHLLKSKCKGLDVKCNELQLKGKTGSASNIGLIDIDGTKNCDFKNTDVIYIKFTVDEIKKGLHKKHLCSECLTGSLTPEVKKGNILVGQ